MKSERSSGDATNGNVRTALPPATGSGFRWPFSWESAMREAQRMRQAGYRVRMRRKWYGWVIVDETPAVQSFADRMRNMDSDIQKLTKRISSPNAKMEARTNGD